MVFALYEMKGCRNGFKFRGSLFTHSRLIRETYLIFGCICIWACLFLGSDNLTTLGPGSCGVLATLSSLSLGR